MRHFQHMNDALIPIWIITEKDGTINCTHCLGCKAGFTLSSSLAKYVSSNGGRFTAKVQNK